MNWHKNNIMWSFPLFNKWVRFLCDEISHEMQWVKVYLIPLTMCDMRLYLHACARALVVSASKQKIPHINQLMHLLWRLHRFFKIDCHPLIKSISEHKGFTTLCLTTLELDEKSILIYFWETYSLSCHRNSPSEDLLSITDASEFDCDMCIVFNNHRSWDGERATSDIPGIVCYNFRHLKSSRRFSRKRHMVNEGRFRRQLFQHWRAENIGLWIKEKLRSRLDNEVT